MAVPARLVKSAPAMKCTRHDGWVKGLEAICADDEARRELLWIRAMQKDGDDHAKKIEELDPGVRRRLAWAIAWYRNWEPMLQWSYDPEDAWGRIYDVCFDTHVARILGKPLCECDDCLWMRSGVHWRREPAGSQHGR